MLAALLSQNPHVYVSASSPLVGLMYGAKHMWDTSEHKNAREEDGQMERVLNGMIDDFYAHVEKPIILDKNRAWANPENQEMLRGALGREPKIVATVRPIAPILASFLMLIRKNPANVSFIDQELQRAGIPLTDENRCALLMSEGGHVYQAWSVLKMGIEKYPQNVLMIDYDTLMLQPETELARIYSFLQLPTWKHDIQAIVNPVVENDEKAYNLPGMHAVRKELKKTAPPPQEVLGEKLFTMYQGGEFWRGR